MTGMSVRSPRDRRAGRAPRAAARVVQALGLPVLLMLGWWAYSERSQSFYLPPPQRIAAAFADVWFGPAFVDDVLPSVARLLTGLVAAVLLGIGLGVPIGSSPRLRALVEPVLEFFRAIPPPVLVPLIMLLVGIDDRMKVLVVVSGCIWPILLNTVEGVRAVDAVLTDTARGYRIRGAARLRHLVLPAASPQIMTGIRQALSIGIILMVISEMFASSSGLGFTVVQLQRSFAIPEMWSGIVLLGLLGIGLAFGFRLLENRILSWYHGQRRVQRTGRA